MSPPRTVVAAATCTLYESRASVSTSVTFVPFDLKKFSSGASLSVTLPTMILSTVNVPEDDKITVGTGTALESSGSPLTDGYMTGSSKKDVDQRWIE